MVFGLNTYHITDRYGWYESGIKDKDALLYSTKEIINLGFRHVELLLDVGSKDDGVLRPQVIEQLVDLKNKYSISYSAHLPYKYVDIGSLNETIRQTSVKLILQAIEIADIIGIDKLVLHPVGAESKPFDLSFYPANADIKSKIIHEMVDQIRKSLTALVEKIDPRRLCLENLPYIDFAPFTPLLHEFDLGVCIDIGHCILRNDDPIDFINRFADRLGVIHLHDVADFRSVKGIMKYLDHEPLGTGIVAIPSILRLLQDIGFSGCVVLEHLEEKKALQSIKYLKHYFNQESVKKYEF